ncbi:hypothetical protein K469DRAFT_203581 [Zopfia rhizophila CBS 207.26]|uniref:Uncharacterized protein n=1 Tax=Zopfia rhizophila CBS 207.26 TaxID=1314779 RepID=A0A6A6DW69_9PEZI|nr:hypothetical protein K469DRAFT_203581 [Zopfia rhizophila CBS 207.26]
MRKAVCQASKDCQWGFSSHFEWINLLLLICWTLTMWALWLDAFSNNRSSYHGHEFRTFLAVRELSKAIRRTLGDEAEKLPNDELKAGLKTFDSGMSLTDDDVPDDGVEMIGCEPGHSGTSTHYILLFI